MHGISAKTYALAHAFVGADAHIDPRRLYLFYGNLRQIRNFYRADRVVGPYGADWSALPL